MKSIERNKKNRIAAAITAALVPMASAIVAPGVAAQEVNDAEKAVALETIEVTATRRAGSLQEVPINISAVTNDLMEQQDLEEACLLRILFIAYHFILERLFLYVRVE